MCLKTGAGSCWSTSNHGFSTTTAELCPVCPKNSTGCFIGTTTKLLLSLLLFLGLILISSIFPLPLACKRGFPLRCTLLLVTAPPPTSSTSSLMGLVKSIWHIALQFHKYEIRISYKSFTREESNLPHSEGEDPHNTNREKQWVKHSKYWPGAVSYDRCRLWWWRQWQPCDTTRKVQQLLCNLCSVAFRPLSRCFHFHI